MVNMVLWLQGPPGTGKTKTLQAFVEVLLALAKALGSNDTIGQILACAETNPATDNVLERLVQSDHSVVRVGHPERVGPAAQAHAWRLCICTPEICTSFAQLKLAAKAHCQLAAHQLQPGALSALDPQAMPRKWSIQ